jgi:hypothetical protein
MGRLLETGQSPRRSPRLNPGLAATAEFPSLDGGLALGSKKKKDKKEKKEAEQSDIKVVVEVDETLHNSNDNGNNDTAKTDKKKDKKSKKDKKEKVTTETATEAESAMDVDADLDEGVDAAEKSKKSKKDKKDKKRKQDDAEESAEPDDDESFGKKPKSKVQSTSADAVTEMRAQLNLVVNGESDDCIFTPFVKFDQVTMPSKVMAVCKNFEKPSPVQAQCWPIVLSRRDVIGIAATGSGSRPFFSFLFFSS